MPDDKAKPLYDVTIESGKYRFVYYAGNTLPEAYRWGDRWEAFERIMLGSKAILAMVQALSDGDKVLNDNAIAIAEEAFKAGYDVGQKDADEKRYDLVKRWSEYEPSQAVKELTR